MDSAITTFRTVDLTALPEDDAKFYREDAVRAWQWQDSVPHVKEYRGRYVCGEIAFFDCIDERQANTPETLGLPLGVSTPIRSAGNMLGEYSRNVEAEILRLIKRQYRSLKPGEAPRPIMVLYVTHSSHVRPHDDSCAAWSHKTDEACAEAARQVALLNREYVSLAAGGQTLNRFVVAFHLHAYTDLEANVWHGEKLSINPMDYVAGLGDASKAKLGHERLEADIQERMRMTFPFNDGRFSGLSREMHDGVVRQIGDMFVANVNLVRQIAAGEAEASKAGHQGRRVLVGRGWGAYDASYDGQEANFTVSDYSELNRDLAIAGKYVLANRIMDATRNGGEVYVPFHVNILYGGWDEYRRQADRCASARLALGIGRYILGMWRRTAGDGALREAFYNEVGRVIAHKGGGPREIELLSAVFSHPRRFFETFRVYVSVSYHDTHALELIATTQDVANS